MATARVAQVAARGSTPGSLTRERGSAGPRAGLPAEHGEGLPSHAASLVLSPTCPDSRGGDSPSGQGARRTHGAGDGVRPLLGGAACPVGMEAGREPYTEQPDPYGGLRLSAAPE